MKSKKIEVKNSYWKPTEDKELCEAMQGLRRSSASSPHTLKSRKGTRGSQKRNAIESNW